jgi:NADH:ubiquinone oxidoreductase subunit
MLTLLKKIFTWWNQETFGTKLKTILFGKFVGSDISGNKYYEGKNGKRWVIYSNEIDASKIPVEWYSWMHFTKNRIEKKHDLEKFKWQKPHQSNLTGTEEAYYPNKHNTNVINKKYKSWKSE